MSDTLKVLFNDTEEFLSELAEGEPDARYPVRVTNIYRRSNLPVQECSLVAAVRNGDGLIELVSENTIEVWPAPPGQPNKGLAQVQQQRQALELRLREMGYQVRRGRYVLMGRS